jgi:hypothetical protein
LSRDSQAQGPFGLAIAAALVGLGFQEEAELLLRRLANDPGSQDQLKKEAQLCLENLRAGQLF